MAEIVAVSRNLKILPTLNEVCSAAPRYGCKLDQSKIILFPLSARG